jgi:hypothetical protein
MQYYSVFSIHPLMFSDQNFCTHHQPCQNQGTCRNTGQGSYHCTCPEGFTGTNCEIEKDDCQHHSCLNGGTCMVRIRVLFFSFSLPLVFVDLSLYLSHLSQPVSGIVTIVPPCTRALYPTDLIDLTVDVLCYCRLRW